MSRLLTKTVLFLALLVILIGAAMWILNGEEVGSLVSLAEEAMKETGVKFGESFAAI